MKPDYDILVIGGGLVGASLACALRSSSLRIGVIEAVSLSAASQPSYDDRTLTLAYGSKRIFESLGLWSDMAAEANPIERIHVSDRGRFGFARLSAMEAGLPALGYVIPNRVLGAVLIKALEASTDIEWMCPATMQSLEFMPGYAAVKINHQATGKTLTTRLVIAADGAHSAVRQAVGIDALRTEYQQSAIVTSVSVSSLHRNIAYERFTETGPLALLPLSTGRCGVVWSVAHKKAETILAWSDAEFLRHLQERFGDRLGMFAQLAKRSAYPLALTRVSQQVRQRLALIGNAAHTVHPVAGQGFNLGLRDVAAMAEIISDAARAGQDIGDLSVLRRYENWRQRDNRVTSTFTNGLIQIFSNDFPPLAWVRNAGLVAVDLLPPLKRKLIRVTSGLAGRLPRLARGLPL